MTGKAIAAIIVASLSIESLLGAGGMGGGDMGGGGMGGGDMGGGGGPGGAGGSLTYDSFISVTTNANCLIREGVLFGSTPSLSASVAPAAAAGVTALAHGVFAGNTTITTVNLANTSIAEVPSDCFAGCTALTSVTLPASCAAIGPSAFAGCSALSSFTASGVTAVGRDAFRGCTALAAVAGASDIGSYAYAQSGVTAADVSSVSELGEGAFAGCESLVSAAVAENDVLPAALFAGCTALDVADWSSVAVFGQASLAGIPADALTISSSAEVGACAFAANEATAATTLSALPASYDADSSFLGREVSYAVNSTDYARIEANELVTWLLSVADGSAGISETQVAQPTDSDTGETSYATASLETWLASSSNLNAILAFCYGDGAETFDVLGVGGTNFTFAASSRSAVTVTPEASFDLSTGDAGFSEDNLTLTETETSGVYAAAAASETDACFVRLRFEKSW